MRRRDRALERLGPFELKDKLAALADASARASARLLLNAGRGEPNWAALAPREAFFALGKFAVQDYRRANWGDELGREPAAGGAARRLRAFLSRLPSSPGRRLLVNALRYGVRELGFEADAFVRELASGAMGDHYPQPVRMLPHAERVVRRYLEQVLLGGSSRGALDLFAAEGATAGICYLFDSLLANGVLRRGERIALAVPIFSPYLEIPRLERYAFDVVRLEASERRADGSHSWQIPDAEIDKLRDPAIKALFLVNPSNPPSVALRPRTVRRLARLVRARRPDLIVISDDVYASFIPGFRSLLAALPRNTVCLYSFSKLFGATGWRLGVIALHRDNVIDAQLAKRGSARRYATLALEPRKLRFLDRLAADSRSVALNHTAGLSTPQQAQMTLMALDALLGGEEIALTREIVQRRLRALYRGLGAPLPPDPLRAGYYAELDLEAWAERRYGARFLAWLKRRRRPIDFLLRLARRSATVLVPGSGFGGPEWSVRVSLANLPEEAYAKIGAHLAGAARAYVAAWRRAERVSPAPRAARARR